MKNAFKTLGVALLLLMVACEKSVEDPVVTVDKAHGINFKEVNDYTLDQIPFTLNTKG